MPFKSKAPCNRCGKVSCDCVDFYRPSARERGYDTEWNKLRNDYITHNPICEVCELAGRVKPAEIVHHRQTIEDRPDLRLVWSNLQSVCRPCHRAIHSDFTIRVVTGPPDSGKTTYVNKFKTRGDIVWDYDVLISALTGLPLQDRPRDTIEVMMSMLDGFLDGVEARRHRRDVWIISANPERAEAMASRLGATLVTMGPNYTFTIRG